MACMLEKMIDRYPNVKIYFLLNDDLRDEIDESVKTICSHYEVDLIELVDIHKINGHPSVKGMRQICEQIEAYISSNH